MAGSIADHPRRAEVLGALRAAPAPLGIAEIAEAVGIHANTARFHLDALAEQGAVVRTLAEPVGRGRPRVLYTASPGMDRGGPRRYGVLARVLVGALAADPEPARRALEAGRGWGARLAADLPRPPGRADDAVGALVGVLAELDFAPRHVPGPDAARGQADQAGRPASEGDLGHIRLGHCPFLELAEEFGGVVCRLHLGVLQGLLAGADAPLHAAAIEPFAEPDACLVRLARR